MNFTLRLILLLPGLFIPSIAMAQTVVEYIHTDALGSIVAVTDEKGVAHHESPLAALVSTCTTFECGLQG